MDVVIQKLKCGDSRIYREIVKTKYAYFYNLACCYTKDSVVAQEIVQDVFVKLWEGRSSLLDDTVLDAYLARLVKNRSVDYIRSRRLQLKNQEEYFRYKTNDYWVENSKLDEYVYEELLEKIQKAISELPKNTCRLFEMSRKEEMTYKEIAGKVGLTEKAVEYHISKALKILKEKLLYIFVLISLGCLFF